MDLVGSTANFANPPEFWQTLADNIPQLAWVADPSGYIYWYNKRWFDYTGTTLSEMEGWGWQAVHHPDHVERVVAGFTQAVEQGQPFEDVFPLRRADGQFRQFLTRAEPIRDEAGRITHWFGTNTDVTAEKEAALALAKSEAQFRTVAEAMPGMLFVTTSQGSNVYVNDGYRTYTGRPNDELLGDGWLETLHPDDAARGWAIWSAAIERGGRYEAEYRFLRHDGEWRWHAVRALPIAVAGGEASRWVGTCIDIHERRLAEEAIWARLNALPQMVWSTRADGFHDFYNDRWYEYTGVPQGSSDGDEWNGMFHPDDRDGAWELWRQSLATGEPYEIEYRLRHHSGGYRWVLGRALPIRDKAGRIERWMGTCTDIHDRREAEDALRDSEERFRTLFESMDQGFCLLELIEDEAGRCVDHRFLATNPAFKRQSGLPDAAGRTVREMIPDLGPQWFERYGRIARSRKAERFLDHAEPLGRWFDCYSFPIDSPDLPQVAVLFTDVTKQREQQLALERSEARLRAVIEAAPIGLVFADASGRITGGNKRVEEILGSRVTASTDIGEYKADYVAFHADGRQVESGEYPLARVLAEGEDRAELVCHIQRADGSRVWVRYAAAPILDAEGGVAGGVVAFIDVDREQRLSESLEREVQKVVAEREAAQEALRQSQKLEAMGQLTGGVAHDFNNLLTPIIGSLDLLHRKGLGDERTQRLIDGALQSAERAKTLVQRLLAFARRQPLKATAIDLARTVAEMGELVASTSGPRVRVEIDIEPGLPPAHADGNQLEMALLNLSVNARDAMPDGGTLSIGVARRDDLPADLVFLNRSSHLVLTVGDTGVGMDEETRTRAIEPFFSTKGIGKGTGLGLSMVHGLAAQLGGALRIESKPGEGTRIELWLPISGEAAGVTAARSDAAQTRGRGTVLLVDDEGLVRSSTASMLNDLGFSVVEADSAEAALAEVRAGLRPDLLVTDQLMPGISGTDLAVRLRRNSPLLPVLIVSGYAEAESLSPGFPHLSKPFRHADLAASIAALTGVAVEVA